MINKLFVASTMRNKMPPEKKPRGRSKQSEVFFPLAIVAHHVVSPDICPIQIFDRAIVISDKVRRTSTLFASPAFWFLRNITLPVTN